MTSPINYDLMNWTAAIVRCNKYRGESMTDAYDRYEDILHDTTNLKARRQRIQRAFIAHKALTEQGSGI